MSSESKACNRCHVVKPLTDFYLMRKDTGYRNPTVDLSVGEAKEPDPLEGKNRSAVERGRRGGVKGGAARKAALSPAKRRAIAKKAAAARWGGRKNGA